MQAQGPMHRRSPVARPHGGRSAGATPCTAVLLCALSLSGCAKSEAEWMADLADPDPLVRELAVAALGETAPPEAGRAFAALLAQLDERAPPLRARVLASLEKLADPALASWLADDPLTSLHPALSPIVCPALQRQGPVAAARLASRLARPDGGDPRVIGPLLWACGEPGLEAFRGALRSPEPSTRLRAARAASALGRTGAALVPDLARHLSDPEPGVRASAGRAVLALDARGGLGVPEAVAAVLDPDPGLREALRPLAIRIEIRRLAVLSAEEAPESIERLESYLPGALDVLAAEIAQQHEGRSLAALRALQAWIAHGAPEPPAPLAELRRALALDPPAGRLHAAFALARLGPGALPALGEVEKALADRVPAVRVLAGLTLARLGPSAAPAKGTLQFTLQHEANAAVKQSSTLALRAIAE